jgi:hypothetical protein
VVRIWEHDLGKPSHLIEKLLQILSRDQARPAKKAAVRR